MLLTECLGQLSDHGWFGDLDLRSIMISYGAFWDFLFPPGVVDQTLYLAVLSDVHHLRAIACGHDSRSDERCDFHRIRKNASALLRSEIDAHDHALGCGLQRYHVWIVGNHQRHRWWVHLVLYSL